MMRTLMIGLAGMLVTAQPASAALFNVVFTGKIAVFPDGDQSIDELALFGPRNGVLDGQAFTATFVIDAGVPGAAYSYGATSSSASGSGSTSPIRASLTINGTTVDFDAPPFGSASADTTSLTKTTGPSLFNTSFSKFGGGSNYSAELNFSVTPVQPFASADYRDLLSTDLALSTVFFPAGAPNGFAYLQAVTNDGPGGMPVPTTTPISFVADHLTVSAAVPEPTSWALMLAGCGVAGVALRRKRVPALAA
jgi:hypothetical protein